MNEQPTSTIEIESEELVSAIVYSNGEIEEVNKRYDSKRTRKKKDTNSMDTDEDDFGEQYASGRVYRPTLAFKNLTSFSADNVYHSKCISQKSIDACLGWDIVTVDRKGVPIKTEEFTRSNKDNKLYDFFDGCTLFTDFVELPRRIVTDYETFGFAVIEMTRKKNGTPARFYHLPATTCRIARDLTSAGISDSDLKYVVQVVNTHERIFKIFDGVAPTIREPKTGNLMTEVIFISSYHVLGGKYGIPDWVPCLQQMIGNQKVSEYNINFFNNEAVPRFAVIVQGGKMDDESKNYIKNYFKKDLKGVQNAHKTLVLTSPKGTEIKLTPLAVEMKDGGFRYYRKDNRDEIISAHGVPPHRVQVFDSGSSSTLSPGFIFDLDKIYKYSRITPLQEKVASMFNRVIKLGFKINDKKLQFKPLDIGEEKYDAEIKKIIAGAHEKYYSTGAMTIDEIRSELKLKRFNDMPDTEIDTDVKEWARIPKPVYLLRQSMMMQSIGTDMNPNGQNLNETPNEHDDKSREQTGSTQFSDDQLKSLVMKSNIEVNQLVQKVDSALSIITEKIEEVSSNV